MAKPFTVAFVCSLLLLVPQLLAQTAGTEIVFPTPTTGLTECLNPAAVLPGADGGTATFSRGNFFAADSQVWFGTSAGFVPMPGCFNFFAFGFSPAATDLTFVLKNFNITAGRVTVFVTDGHTSTTTVYQLAGGDSVPVTLTGPVLFVNVTGSTPTTIAVTDVRVGHQPSANAGLIAFDFPSTAPDARILISKRSGDAFSSAWQVASPTGCAFKVGGTLYDALLGQPKSGTVYLRIDDPPDPSLYAVGDSHAGDNFPGSSGSAAFVGGPGLGVPFAVTAGANGHFEATVTTTSQVAGNNYRIRGSVDSAFGCAAPTPCSDTGVFTLWKRIYVEEEHMFRAGSFISRLAEAGGDMIPVSDPAAFTSLTPGVSKLELVHADNAGEGYYFDILTFQKLEQTATGAWLVRTTDPLPHDYGSNSSSPTGLMSVLRDAVGVIVSGSYDAPDVYVQPLFASMFTDIATTQAVTVAEIPFVREMSTTSLIFYASRWLQNGTAVNPFVRHAAPNVFHRIVMTQTPLVQDPQTLRSGAELGVTSVAGGAHYSAILSKRIDDIVAGNVADPTTGGLVGAEYLHLPSDVVAAETVAHETVHFWVHNTGVDGNGHCNFQRWQHDGLNCLMHTPYAGPGLADGEVYLHYESHGADSEYSQVRRAADPVPQQ